MCGKLNVLHIIFKILCLNYKLKQFKQEHFDNQHMHHTEVSVCVLSESEAE